MDAASEQIVDNPPAASTSRGGGGRTFVVIVLLLLMIAAAVAGWLKWTGRLDLPRSASPAASTQTVAALPTPSASQVATQQALAQAQASMVVGGVETRLALLEERLARIDREASAASGNAARAEGLLIALATRRVLAKGGQLGFLEDQLKLRFGGAQPDAVRTITEFAKDPVTLDELTGGLDALAPALAEPGRDQSGFARMRRELTSLFTVRRGAARAMGASDRVLRARLMLVSGKTGAAIEEVSKLPGADSAANWMAEARRYNQAQQAIDVIETAAMLEPDRLRDAAGQTVSQASPIGRPAPAPVASASP